MRDAPAPLRFQSFSSDKTFRLQRSLFLESDKSVRIKWLPLPDSSIWTARAVKVGILVHSKFRGDWFNLGLTSDGWFDRSGDPGGS